MRGVWMLEWFEYLKPYLMWYSPPWLGDLHTRTDTLPSGVCFSMIATPVVAHTQRQIGGQDMISIILP